MREDRDVPSRDRSGRYDTFRRLSWIALATLLATGCGDDAPAPAKAAPAVDAASKEATAQAAPAPAASPAGGDPSRFFAGAALDTVRGKAIPAGGLLSQDMQSVSTLAADLEGCRATFDPSASYLIDLDADGQQEAIGFYTMGACRDGSSNMRIMAVFRRGATGAWVPVTQVALAVGTQPDRQVVGIDAERGIIALAGEPDELGGTSPPQLVEIPPAGDRDDGTPRP